MPLAISHHRKREFLIEEGRRLERLDLMRVLRSIQLANTKYDSATLDHLTGILLARGIKRNHALNRSE